jgi:hypothetical protein
VSNVGKISLTSIKADATHYAAKHNIKSQIKEVKIKQRAEARNGRVSGGKKLRQKMWLTHIMVIRTGVIWQSSIVRLGLRTVVLLRCFKRRFAAHVARTFLARIFPLDCTADMIKGKVMRAW